MQIDTESFSVGDQVRVKESVVVYHHPEHRNQAFDIKGQEGGVIQVVKELHGKPISANFPYVVKFSGKFRAHLQAHELEKI
ncbi:MAG: ferredoxin-thioredoxin reductase variable chain [Leptolyngbyaceae cyanobacterium bins.302]|nr:ferredoxin-thioredoxin reductase variable chain [Leptolyngbyaceae cyanobacterium bins.302]